MRIADIPPADRPRERLESLGADSLSDRELLAVLLGTGGAAGVGAHVLAERLLARFGSLTAVGRAHTADLAAVAGIGPAKATAVAAAFTLGRRAGRPDHTPVIRGSGDLAEAVAPMLRGRSRERLVVVACDRGNRVRACEVLSDGAVDRTPLPVREVVVAVLRRDGSALAVAHNHPSGDPTPSTADVAATQRVAEAADAAGLRFLDHIVVADDNWRSVRAVR